MREKLLEIIDFEKVYKDGSGALRALNNFSMTLYRGEMVAIMGASGSGKSTLLKLIGGLDRPSKGRLILEGTEHKKFYKEPHATAYRGENIGFVFQDFNLIKDLTVEENLALPLLLMKHNKDQVRQRVGDFINLLGLEGKAKARPYKLSGGQQQRVAIARALISHPPVLLADEPTGNLDLKTSQAIMTTLVDLQRQLDQSIILVTHDPQVAAYADRVIFIQEGKQVGEYVKIGPAGDVAQIMDLLKKVMA